MLEQSSINKNEKELNTININPKIVQVQMAGHWKKKDTSKIRDY